LQESIFFGVRILLQEEIINRVDLERLYQHSLAIEGIRHFQVNPEKLAETADYIRKELKAYGLQVQEQVFTFDGIPHEFKNVEGILGDEKKPALLITSHYDTVQNSPGANDNGSGVVAMLEVARILARQKMDNFCLRFVSFTQEETHPIFYSRLFKKRLELGLVDKKDRYLRFHTQQLVKNFLKQFWRLTSTGKSYTEGAKLTFEKFKDDLDEREQAYFSYLLELLQELKNPTDWIGDSLRSDHAPFLKYGIPAIMVTDTANFRYPFYHTEADTIDKLDFHFIRKVCQATLVGSVSH